MTRGELTPSSYRLHLQPYREKVLLQAACRYSLCPVHSPCNAGRLYSASLNTTQVNKSLSVFFFPIYLTLQPHYIGIKLVGFAENESTSRSIPGLALLYETLL